LRVIRADAAVQPLLRQLLGDTLIVPELGPRRLRPGGTAAGNYTYVTLAGEVAHPSGHLHRRRRQTTAPASVPPRSSGARTRLRNCRRSSRTLQEQIEETSRQKGALLGEQTEIQAGLQQDQTALRQQEFSIATHEGEVNALRNALRISHQRIDTVVYEIQSLAAQEEPRLSSSGHLLTTLPSPRRGTRTRPAEELAEAGVALETLQQQRESANTALTEARVAVATEEQVTDSFARQQAPLEQRVRELTQLLEQRRADIGGFIQRRDRPKPRARSHAS
jgi:chromosome segregation ATPase